VSSILRLDRTTVAALVLVVVHFAVLAGFHEPALSGPDANGYFAQAKLLATEGHTSQVLDSPIQLTGAHWIDAGDGRYFSKYPPGFPLLLAIPYSLFGPTASLWVDPLMVSLTLLALFLICRYWMTPGWALAATALMATSPLVNEHAVAGFAHTPVAFFLLWGMYGLVRWTQRHSLGWLALAGFCVGMIPTIRYAEVLYAGAFALFIILRRRDSHPTGHRALPTLLAAALPAAVPMFLLAIRNHLAFGAFWQTGYAASQEQTGFGWGYFADHWASYLEGLMGPGMGLLFGLGVFGLAVLCTRPDTRPRGLLLVSLILPTTLLYMAYYWQPDPKSLRFLLPTYYLYAMAGVWLLGVLVERLGRPALIGTIVVLGLSAVWGSSRSIENLAMQQDRNATLVRITQAVEQHVPAGSILLVDRQVGQHLDVIGQWRLGQAEVLGGEGRRPRGFGPGLRPGWGLPPGNRPSPADRPSPAAGPQGQPSPRNAALGDRAAPAADPLRLRDGPNPMAGGAMERLAKYRDLSDTERAAMVRQDLVAWAGEDASIYVLGPKDEAVAQMRRLGLGLDNQWQELATIELPKTEEPDGRFGRGAGRPRSKARFRALGRPGMGGPGGPMGPFGAPRPDQPLVLIEVQL